MQWTESLSVWQSQQQRGLDVYAWLRCSWNVKRNFGRNHRWSGCDWQWGIQAVVAQTITVGLPVVRPVQCVGWRSLCFRSWLSKVVAFLSPLMCLRVSTLECSEPFRAALPLEEGSWITFKAYSEVMAMLRS